MKFTEKNVHPWAVDLRRGDKQCRWVLPHDGDFLCCAWREGHPATLLHETSYDQDEASVLSDRDRWECRRIVNLIQTCSASPAQWEGELEDGRAIYIRYRWGSLGFGVGATLDDAIDDCEYVKDIGEQFDGYIAEDEMLVHLAEFGFEKPGVPKT